MIQVVHPGSGSWFFTHPGSLIERSKRHRIPDPQQCTIYFFSRGQALGRLVCTEDPQAEAIRGRAVLPHTGDIRRRAEIQRRSHWWRNWWHRSEHGIGEGRGVPYIDIRQFLYKYLRSVHMCFLQYKILLTKVLRRTVYRTWLIQRYYGKCFFFSPNIRQ